MVDKYVVNTDEDIKHFEYFTRVNNLLICGGSIETKTLQHVVFTLQLLTK